jgi:hypothetical protein
MIKYKIVIMTGEIILLKYDPRNSKLWIGGYNRDAHLIMGIFEDYFGIENYKIINTQINKFRIVCSLKMIVFFKIIKEMDYQGIVLKKVKSLGRGW